MKMAFGFLLASVLAAVVVAYILTKFFREPEMPSLPQNPWWGEGEPQAEDTAIRPFTINIPDEVSFSKNQLWVPSNAVTMII